MARAQKGQAAELEATLQDYESALRGQVQERPLTAVAAAFGVGYVLGGGLTPRLAWMGLTAVGRVTMVDLLRDLFVAGRPAGGPYPRSARTAAR